MYTIQSYTDEQNKALRSRIVTVTFTDGTDDLTQAFRFSIGTIDNVVKNTVTQFLDELNAPFVPITGDITEVVVVPEPQPTQAQLDKDAWHLDWKRLQAYKKLKDHGVNSLTPAQVTALIDKVETGLQAGYGDII